MREAAADGPSIARLPMADMPERLGKQWEFFLDDRCVLRRMLPHHRADAQCVAVHLDRIQARHRIEIDQVGGTGETKIEQRHQRLPARQHAGVVQFRQQDEKLRARTRGMIAKRSRLHPAAFSAANIRAGVMGNSVMVTPKSRNASSTAEVTAAEAAIVPLSPAPLMPSGLSGVGDSM